MHGFFLLGLSSSDVGEEKRWEAPELEKVQRALAPFWAKQYITGCWTGTGAKLFSGKSRKTGCRVETEASSWWQQQFSTEMGNKDSKNMDIDQIMQRAGGGKCFPVATNWFFLAKETTGARKRTELSTADNLLFHSSVCMAGWPNFSEKKNNPGCYPNAWSICWNTASFFSLPPCTHFTD